VTPAGRGLDGPRIGLWVGLVGAVGLGFAASDLGVRTGLSADAFGVLAVAWIMGAWWVSEALPLGLTALLPVAVFPLTGLVDATTVSRAYTSPIIMLLLGGFMLALTVERSGAHRRLALHVLLGVGTSPRRLVLGFAIAAAALSMWISNTATTLIMTPIALAIADRSAAEGAGGRFTIALLLATAYGASVGGMGTPVGTPPNLIAMRAYQATFPGDAPLTFPRWLILALPSIVVVVPAVWWSLTRVYPTVPKSLELGAERVLRDELSRLGRWSAHEVRALGLFGLTALAWVTRPDLRLGESLRVEGWASRLGLEGTHDGSVAMLAVVAAAALPAGRGDGTRLLPWATAVRVPWDLVLLFGGGIALATGFTATGLSQAAGEALARGAGSSQTVFVGLVALFCTFGTEVISNTALANIVMPIFAETARAGAIAPAHLLVPAAMACSCAFMMPAATGPNAIAFGTGRVRIAQMVRAGIVANLLAWAGIVAGASLSHAVGL